MNYFDRAKGNYAPVREVVMYAVPVRVIGTVKMGVEAEIGKEEEEEEEKRQRVLVPCSFSEECCEMK